MTATKLIDRQIAKSTLADGRVDIDRLRALVDGAYMEMDDVRKRTERARSLMVEEMAVLNDELERALEKVGRRKDWFKAAMDNIEQGLCLFNADNILTVFNDKFATIYGLQPSDLKVGMHLSEVLELRIRGGVYFGRSPSEYQSRYLERAEKNERSVVVHQLSNGQEIEIRHQPLPGGGFLSTHYDITERRQSEREVRRLAHLASHDSLTSLPNRSQMNAIISESMDDARLNGTRMALFYVDLDGFKHINDTLGHVAGDRVLQVFAERLSAGFVDDDIKVGRLSGDEFLIVVERFGATPELDDLARQVCALAAEPICLGDQQRVTIGASVGIAIGPNSEGTHAALIKEADLALYRAKSQGGNTHIYFTREMDAAAEHRRRLATDLRRAIAEKQLLLHYQPQLDLRDGKISGYEALVRWQHPELGLIAPADFISIAEESGQISAIGEWVLNRACDYATGWPDGIRLAVNLSPVQLKQQNVAGMVEAALRRSGLPANRLELEITEGVLVEDSAVLRNLIISLRDMGVSLALDDFGTGYSSLSYLAKYPVQKIKIDRSFTRQLGNRSEINTIMYAIVGLGRGLGATVTAEGVESTFQLNMLKAAGCDQAQGFLIGKPGEQIIAETGRLQNTYGAREWGRAI